MRAFLLIVALASAAGCSERPKPVAGDAPKVEGSSVIFPDSSPQLVAITTVAATQAAESTKYLPGRLVWDEERTVRLYPAFAGRVVRIYAKPGDQVQAGQALAQLASPDFGVAQAEARKAAADVALATRNLTRVRELVRNGVTPEKDLHAAEAEHARAEADLAQTAARMKLYGGGASIDSSFALKSPIAGVVVERNLNPGQELRADMSSGAVPALFVITDPSRLWLALDATERDLDLLKPGQTLRFRANAYPDETFNARLDTVADFIDPQTRTVRARGTVANTDRRLKGEMLVTAELKTPPRAGVAVPAKAVFVQGDKRYAFIEESRGRFVRKEVKTTGDQGGLITVTHGIVQGQNVVVEGSLFLQQIFQAAQSA